MTEPTHEHDSAAASGEAPRAFPADDAAGGTARGEREPPPLPMPTPIAPTPIASAPEVAAVASPAEAVAAEELAADEAPAEDAPKKKRRRGKKVEEPASSGLPKNLEAMDWYVLKVQSNREDSIAANIQRRLKMAALDHYVDKVEVPTERLLEIKDGKKKVVKRKFYPGYVILHMEMHGEAWSVIRDTPGVGHFLGAENKPLPMSGPDLDKLKARMAPPAAAGEAETKEAAPKPAIEFVPGDRVVIKEGPFENFEGDIDEVNEAKGTVRVVVQIFGRPNPVEIEYWQVGRVRT